MVFLITSNMNISFSLQEMISRSTSSKFAFMDGEGVAIVGDFIEVGGIYYSNQGYKSYPYIGTTYYGRGGGYHFRDGEWYEDYMHHSELAKGHNSKASSKSAVGKAKDDDTTYVASLVVSGEFDEEDFNHMRSEALVGGSDDPAVVGFMAKDGDRGLTYVDAEFILDFLCEDMDLNIYTCEFDERQKVLYVTLDWNSIIMLPTVVCNAEWSVVY